ncbi:hypothetical protein O988_09513, partial [Pseudogymnoascus sp. VKM F-3808]
TNRQRRSTAGNRLSTLLQAAAADDELELLFASDEEDAGFSDASDAASDVQMDSSSDEDDAGPSAPGGAEDLEGEAELQKAVRAERIAKKRKAATGIPTAFRKKPRVVDTASTTTAEAPRPKKKSERASWIPSAEEAPLRASDRKTTRLSKEQLEEECEEFESVGGGGED